MLFCVASPPPASVEGVGRAVGRAAGQRSHDLNQTAIDRLLSSQTAKLKACYMTLEKVMPPYFFKSVSDEELGDLLPMMLDIERKSGLQMLERADSQLVLYIKTDELNPLAVSKLMAGRRILRLIVHESKPLPDGKVLVIEQITKGSACREAEPAYSVEALAAAYRRLFGRIPDGFESAARRVNWSEVADLDADRIAFRLDMALRVEGSDASEVRIEPRGKGFQISFAVSTVAREEGLFGRTIGILENSGFRVERSYLREFTRAEKGGSDFRHKAVRINTFYVVPARRGAGAPAALAKLERELNELSWSPIADYFEGELNFRQGFCVASVNLLRAAAEFVHSQLAFVDRNAYNSVDICRFMASYPSILRKMCDTFEERFDPKGPRDTRKTAASFARIRREIAQVNSGVAEKDQRVRTVLGSVLSFMERVLKSNYFSTGKSALAFRLDAGFMSDYEKLSPAYAAAFPPERPYGVFFFWRREAFGFQIRFDEIARGGWRTVVPRMEDNPFELGDSYEYARCESFRECFVLANTQHKKNKDIYEGGSKMLTLLRFAGDGELKPRLWAAQRGIFDAFLSLINFDGEGRLRDKAIVDFLGEQEIIEIGPDENMFDDMIEWMGARAAEKGYVLGPGIISGKGDAGINHKHYGVTSFGVHRYLLRTLRYLGIDPGADGFTVKISGGPFGDVAGNEIKLLNARDGAGSFLMPGLRIVAVTDGPAAAYDPDGLDRDELSRLVHAANLDAFDPGKLRGEGAYIIFNKPRRTESGDVFRMATVQRGRLVEREIDRDEFMFLFQNNICHRADVFIPCGGRPRTITPANVPAYAPNGVPSSRAIVEGANSFISPEARDELQRLGVVIVKDASANKCGVITSSYEIISGLVLDAADFQAVKPALVREVMEILRRRADDEAEWLFAHFVPGGKFMTELTEELSGAINAKNLELRKFLERNPQYVTDDLILSHLPRIFARRFRANLKRIPASYRRAIASVELASRIVYRLGDPATEIRAVLKGTP